MINILITFVNSSQKLRNGHRGDFYCQLEKTRIDEVAITRTEQFESESGDVWIHGQALNPKHLQTEPGRWERRRKKPGFCPINRLRQLVGIITIIVPFQLVEIIITALSSLRFPPSSSPGSARQPRPTSWWSRSWLTPSTPPPWCSRRPNCPALR